MAPRPSRRTALGSLEASTSTSVQIDQMQA